ncbi:DNA-directed RNA polymerase II subunit RPB1 isoform 1 [Tripterygium wilfordii]|uniref:DNA-directed RNA polymerase II subunit RPB1 isoform 1 n=1 Tax=Tripterygium wilfordii TaxID=458696 RepID=A0A7J7E2S7_TRIWF|nr:BTB/POZ domain-containing protein At3g49900 [Tripterygium wilfordii]KAF5752833.1 DNA-directed RNA polymerase II subunit RPB1 isoform 1 [Tripterygium wilfordii]
MMNWGKLGVVDTIYEEDYEYSTSPSLSPSISSPKSPLHFTVQAWSLENRCETDVRIHVQGTCFNLHKDPLTSRSRYLKRQLTELSGELTLSPPLNITAQTFALVAEFCYESRVVLTPFNVTALRVAAELLEMTETDGELEENLKEITESYFRRVVVVNRESAMIVFRSSLSLLPEAETTAFLVSRCIEALDIMDDGEGVDNCFADIVTLSFQDFQILADSMHDRYACHDVLYRTVDLFLEEQNGKIRDEEKIKICNSIDCNKLSPELLMHAVQNPRMPIRFIIRAMLVEQLHTQRSIFSTADRKPHRHHQSRDCTTLGAILQRDAAIRQAAQLKAAMDATTWRIQSLEKELGHMKTLLNNQSENEQSIVKSARSASFHYGTGNTNKIERGERGSASSLNFRHGIKAENSMAMSSSPEDSCIESPRPRAKKNIGRRLIDRLKNSLWVSSSGTKCGAKKSKISSMMEAGHGIDEDIIVVGKDEAFSHKRNCSQG